MVKPRVVETDHGIQGEFVVQDYDKMMRYLRDKGWMETDRIISCGIDHGLALEVGPGPGYLGFEWLKKTSGTQLKGVEISPDMVKLALKNAKEYGVDDRVEYALSDAHRIPFDDNTFDAAFTNGSLHEWSKPEVIFHEIYRVLKPSGNYFISDLRRDMNVFIKMFLWLTVKPKEMKPGLISSINASYTFDEIQSILNGSKMKEALVTKTLLGFEITGQKI